jgi:hypothetical protein
VTAVYPLMARPAIVSTQPTVCIVPKLSTSDLAFLRREACAVVDK